MRLLPGEEGHSSGSGTQNGLYGCKIATAWGLGVERLGVMGPGRGRKTARTQSRSRLKWEEEGAAKVEQAPA